MTPIAVTIAGSDSSGGAGIQADLKTFAALGVYGASVIAALTAQNTKGVTGIHDVPADFIDQQMDAVFSDLDVGAVKIGMLSRAVAIRTVAASLDRYKARNIVLDPVMVATSGDRLLAEDAIIALRNELFRGAGVTPICRSSGADRHFDRATNKMEVQARELLVRRATSDQRQPRRGRRSVDS